MKTQKKYLWLLILPAALLVIYLQAQEASFFESNFDGPWAGSVQMTTSKGKRQFPLVANLNCQDSSGMGYILLSDDLSTAPSGVELFKLMNITCKGNKLTLEAETSGEEPFKHKFVLKYKGAKSTLSGNFTSTDPGLKKGKVTLYPQSKGKMLQKVWKGTVRRNSVKEPVFLQLIQKDELGNGAASDVTAVSGYAFVGEEFGSISNGIFDGIKITGNLVLENEAVVLDLNLKGLKLKGTLRGATFSGKSTFKPAGSKAKPFSLKSASPAELFLHENTVISLNGKNFEAGMVLHVNHPKLKVEDVERTDKSKLMAYLIPSETIQVDQKISIRAVSLNGDSAELSDVFTFKMKEQPITVSFSGDIQPVFNLNCAVSGCHTGSAPSAGLNLSAGASYTNIVDVASSKRPSFKLIKPFDPENSYLIRKIKGLEGSRMPLGRTALGLDIISKFENWALEGALNN